VFTDLTGDKRRPAVIVTDTASVRGPDGHFVFIGTQPPGPHEPSLPVVAGSPEAAAAGLKFPPGRTTVFLRPTKIATLDVSPVSRRLGSLPPVLLAMLDGHLRTVLGL
jgi:mRNA-degrading endonuclease toxin of MazEF toxin-antitoxin module